MPTTVKDINDHLRDFQGANALDKSARESRRAIQQAYRELANAHRWSYLRKYGRITTDLPENDGNIEYDLTGGLFERMVTKFTGINGAISGATQANPVQITSTAHGLSTGAKIRIESVVGMVELNHDDPSGVASYTITVVDVDNFTINGIDGTAFTAYTSGGTWRVLGVWPPWAANGVIVIDTVVFEVNKRETDNILTFQADLAPREDLAAGKEYEKIYRDTYTLPADFISSGAPWHESNWGNMSYVTPDEWLRLQRYPNISGVPRIYTFTGSPDIAGRMAIRLFPFPTDVRTLDFIYSRRPRSLRIDEYNTGNVSITAGSRTVTGSATVFSSLHVGSVIRFSADGKNDPTDFAGTNPFEEEGAIEIVTNATTLTLEVAATQSLASVKFTISDPVDFDDGIMLEAFLRCCEKHLSILQHREDKVESIGAYQQALLTAKEVDSRSYAGRIAGSIGRPGYSPYGLGYDFFGDDVT